jgi:hypothetical protein
MTPEQKKALILARARLRLKGGAPQASASGNIETTGAAMGDVMASLAAPEQANLLQGGMPQRQFEDVRSVSRERVGMGEAAFRGLAQGATLGATDEIVAAILSARPDLTYDQAVDFVRSNNAAAREQRPGAYMAGQVAGGAAATAPIAGPVTAARTLGGAVAAGAAGGATAGAVQGFAEGEGGLKNRLLSSATGAGIGGAIGGAIPAVAAGVGAVRRHVSDWSRSRAMQGQIADQLGVSPGAARLAADTIGADDIGAMRGNIAAAGPDAMLADAGPSAQGALDAAMQRPGSASRIGMKRIEARAADAMGKINKTLDDVLGKPQGAETVKAGVRQGTAAARTSAYEKAYAAPIDYAADQGRALEELLPRVPAKAINDANLLMQLDGDTSRQIMATIADDGAVTYQRLPDVRQWDYIKRALDHAATSGEGQGALGGQTGLGRAYQGLSRTIRDNLRDAVPEYGDALETAADAIKRVQGVETGYTMLRAGTTRESVQDALKGMTGPEKDAVKQGLRDFIDDTLANVRSAVSDPNVDAREARKALGELNSRAARSKMGILLGSDTAKIYKTLDEAGKALGLRAAVSQNSKTAARLAFGERSKELSEPGIIRSALSGRPIRATQRLAENVTGSAPEAVARRSDRLNAELTDLLTRPGQAGAMNALTAIDAAAARYAPLPDAGQGSRAAVNALGFPLLPSGAGAINDRISGRNGNAR